MEYPTTNVRDLADTLKNSKSSAAILIGAGVSKTAGIPTAAEIIEDIRQTRPGKYESNKFESYAEAMAALPPGDRRDLIRDYIKKSKVNLAHLYLGALVEKGFIDRILTTNFDPLATRALILHNVFPAVYDFASTDSFIPGDAADISIFYLHGQHYGFKLLNTQAETESLSSRLVELFNDTKVKRTWIVVGYSGDNDPVFKQLAKMESYDYGLYWVGYENNEPSEQVIKGILSPPGKGAKFISGYNADSFFIQLAKELSLPEPKIIDQPFMFLKDVLENISDITKNDKPTEITQKALRDVERAHLDLDAYKEADIGNLIQKARQVWVFNKYDDIDSIYTEVLNSNNDEAKQILTIALQNAAIEEISEKGRNTDKTKEIEKKIEKLRLTPSSPKLPHNPSKPHSKELVTLKEILENRLSIAGRDDAANILSVDKEQVKLIVKNVYEEELIRSYMHRIYIRMSHFLEIEQQFQQDSTMNIIKGILSKHEFSLHYKKSHQFIPAIVGDDSSVLHVSRNHPCLLHIQVSYIEEYEKLTPVELLISKYLQPINVCGFLIDSSTHAESEFAKLAEDILSRDEYRQSVTYANQRFYLPFSNINKTIEHYYSINSLMKNNGTI